MTLQQRISFIHALLPYKCDYHTTGRVYHFAEIATDTTLLYKIVTFNAVKSIASKEIFSTDRYNCIITKEIKSCYLQLAKPETILYNNLLLINNESEVKVMQSLISGGYVKIVLTGKEKMHKESKKRYNLL